MRAVFWVEKNTDSNGSCLMGAHSLLTPPDDQYLSNTKGGIRHGGSASISAWAEVWDYVGGTSYRAFVAEQHGERTLFAFFDSTVIDMELKQGLMALIDLAESAVGCSRLVVCIDRDISRAPAQGLMKSLRWVGFEPVTLDHWASDVDVTSEKWLFMGMEV
ncbi:related to ornithine decarboxylase antizyme [Cephalotrichum gorgonifer]|uniref:Ornithine decarboxylase antizyme n=1 Tax=Cephalotrichum gorgonifer TaxID=2041049 RepID=A0AAE8MQ27_9PEZI|nr:related to ornithine decarboxylase antizyme [Cephalotrichum gorgonifer]